MTMTGVCIALFLLSLAFATATPALLRHHRRAIARATVADLDRYAAAFQAYAEEHGDWPSATTAPGVAPAGMEAALGPDWRERSPIGGHYVYFVNTAERGIRNRAAVAIVTVGNDGVSHDARVLAEVLRLAGTHPALAHRVKLGFRNEPVLVLEE